MKTSSTEFILVNCKHNMFTHSLLDVVCEPPVFRDFMGSYHMCC